MMAHSDLTGLAVVAVAALLCGILMARLRQPAIVGYILAGVLLGPSLLGLVSNRDAVGVLAELGVVMLLFLIAMELSLRGFMQVWRVALRGDAAADRAQRRTHAAAVDAVRLDLGLLRPARLRHRGQLDRRRHQDAGADQHPARRCRPAHRRHPDRPGPGGRADDPDAQRHRDALCRRAADPATGAGDRLPVPAHHLSEPPQARRAAVLRTGRDPGRPQAPGRPRLLLRLGGAERLRRAVARLRRVPRRASSSATAPCARP